MLTASARPLPSAMSVWVRFSYSTRPIAYRTLPRSEVGGHGAWNNGDCHRQPACATAFWALNFFGCGHGVHLFQGLSVKLVPNASAGNWIGAIIAPIARQSLCKALLSRVRTPRSEVSSCACRSSLVRACSRRSPCARCRSPASACRSDRRVVPPAHAPPGRRSVAPSPDRPPASAPKVPPP
jgi:hypothetical protein